MNAVRTVGLVLVVGFGLLAASCEPSEGTVIQRSVDCEGWEGCVLYTADGYGGSVKRQRVTQFAHDNCIPGRKWPECSELRYQD